MKKEGLCYWEVSKMKRIRNNNANLKANHAISRRDACQGSAAHVPSEPIISRLESFCF